jgi:pathogenesis-related protein 1
MQQLKVAILMLTIMLGAPCAHAAEIDRAAMVAAHNKWRAEVGVGRLGYSTQLEASAQAWADHLKNTNACRMQHSKPDGKYGENLYWASAIIWSDGRREVQQVTPQMAVDSWGGEKADYDYAKNTCKPGKMCGHYTQMVWKSTTEVGCGYAVCADSKDQIWVCQYQPPGNWVGKRPY